MKNREGLGALIILLIISIFLIWIGISLSNDKETLEFYSKNPVVVWF